MRKNLNYLYLLLFFVFLTGCTEIPEHVHKYSNGLCECGEKHNCTYVEGVCECGKLEEKHNHVFVYGYCECGQVHNCVYENGKCDCGLKHECIYEDGKCECGKIDLNSLCEKGKFTALYYDLNNNLIKKSVFNNTDEYYDLRKNNFPVAPEIDGYTYIGWKDVDIWDDMDNIHGVKCTPVYTDSREEIWESIDGIYYAQKFSNKDDYFIINKDDKTITICDSSGLIFGEKGKTYILNGIILSKGESTKFPELSSNPVAFSDVDYSVVFYNLDDYNKGSYGKCMRINQDGTIHYRSSTYNKNRFTQELLHELMFIFEGYHINSNGEKYLSTVESYNYDKLVSRVNIFDCESKIEYLESTNKLKVDIKVYCEVDYIKDSDFVYFSINAYDIDDVIIGKEIIIEEAEKGDKFRVETTFYFDIEDVIEAILIDAEGLDIND